MTTDAFRLTGSASDTEPGHVQATMRVDVPDYPGWSVQVVVSDDGRGAGVIERLEVLPTDPAAPVPGGVSTRLLRRVKAGELLDLARQRIAEQAVQHRAMAYGDGSSEHDQAWSNLAVATERLAAEPTRTGRRGNGVEHYLLWATRYANKVAARDRRPIASLAAEHGLTVQYVRDTITDARRRHGLLTPNPGRGRAGGALTTRAHELLAQLDQEDG